MITCENLYMRYEGGGREILRDLTFHIEPGSFHFLSGVSGAGKSSLLKLLSFSHRPNRGKISMFGEDVTRIPHDELPRLRRRIGMVFQDFRLLDHLTVAENVGLPLKVLDESPRMIREKVKEMLEWVGIGDHYHSRPEILSGGQKQRAAIARAVITKPDLLLADEPSGNLDAYLRDKFMYLFEELNRYGTTILYATHDEELISKFQYSVLRIQDGKLV